MRVAIAGAGNVGRSIAAELIENGHQILLIDKDPHAIKSDTVTEAEWLLADACELSSLEEAGIDSCDVAIAATGDDKANLVMSLLSKTEFGVPRTVARVNHPKNEWLFNDVWGVDVAVSTPRLMCALVEEAVSVGDLVRLLTFHEGEANLVEMTLAGRRVRRSGVRVGDMTFPGRRGPGGGHPRRPCPAAGRGRNPRGRRRTAVRDRSVVREGTGRDAGAPRRERGGLDDRYSAGDLIKCDGRRDRGEPASRGVRPFDNSRPITNTAATSSGHPRATLATASSTTLPARNKGSWTAKRVT